MTIIQTPFPQATNPAIASYNYTDLAENTGVVLLYGGGVNVSGGATYRLDTKAFDPWHVRRGDNGDESNSGRYKIVQFTDSSDAIKFDLDFDTSPFNLPKDISGTIMVNVPYSFDPGVSTDVMSAYMKVYLRRVRNGSETDLDSKYTATQIAADDGTSYADGMFAVTFTTSQVHHFKRGDILRITVEIHAWRSAGSGTCAILVMTDPLARNVAATGGSNANDQITYTGGNALQVYIPFRIQT